MARETYAQIEEQQRLAALDQFESLHLADYLALLEKHGGMASEDVLEACHVMFSWGMVVECKPVAPDPDDIESAPAYSIRVAKNYKGHTPIENLYKFYSRWDAPLGKPVPKNLAQRAEYFRYTLKFYG